MRTLASITVKGFKSIACIENLTLGPMNILIGSNGAGKSNFLDIFSFLHAIGTGNLREYVIRSGGPDRILHFGSNSTPQLTVHLSFDYENLQHEQFKEVQYEIVLSATDELLYPRSEILSLSDKTRGTTAYSRRLVGRGGEAGISDSHQVTGASTPVRNHFNNWALYHFHDTSRTSPIKRTVDVDDNRYLRPDGSNLAAFLHYLQQKHEASYTLIRHTVQRVAPFFDDFRLQPQALNADMIRLEWQHIGSDAYFNASSLSDGTLRFIALATLLLQPEEYRPSVILLDEPELGLHPYAITLLASLVKQTSFESQIILATQSPILLDHFQPEEVLVAERVNGGTTLTRLEPTRLEAWLEDYSLGQLWEKNEVGGRPTKE